MRPVDTENIINNRQQIRLFSGLKFVLCFVYLSISPLFTQVQASWVHLYHLFVEPLAILVSVTENQLFMSAFMYLNMASTFADGLIGFLNLISISRCFGEPTASCFDRLYENSVWFLLAALFILLNLLCVMQFRNLSSQMLEKDLTEEERVRLHHRAHPKFNVSARVRDSLRCPHGQVRARRALLQLRPHAR